MLTTHADSKANTKSPAKSEETSLEFCYTEGVIFLKGLGRAVILLVPQVVGGIIILPVAMLVIKKEQKKLPYFLRWFDNADQYVGRNTETFFKVCDQGNWARYKWLAWRNPLNYLGYMLGFVWSGDEKYIRYDEKTSRVGNTAGCTPGYNRIDIIRFNAETGQVEKFYQRRLIYVWPYFPNKCIEYFNGHKIGNPNTNKPGDHVQIVNRISFWKSYNGLPPANSGNNKSTCYWIRDLVSSVINRGFCCRKKPNPNQTKQYKPR